MTLRTLACAAVLAFALTQATTAAAFDRAAMLVSSAWLADHLKDANLVVLHIGAPEGYAQHIPGARFVRAADIALSTEAATLELPPPEDLRARLEAIGISDDSRVVVYYGQDTVPAATRVIYTLQAAGFGAQASLLDGGMAAWQHDGHAVTADVPAPRSGHLAALKMQPAIVDAEAVRQHAGKAGYAVIDARAPAFYDGAQAGGSKDRAHKLGHIPGAVNVPYSEVTDAGLSLKPADQLTAIFAKAGVKRGDKLMVYCHIGQQATAVIFAARSLGYDASLYDGSFEDWSRRDLPVETK
jgi:thiosulfate/3-mercaptopyruvate sulfurtransferase